MVRVVGILVFLVSFLAPALAEDFEALCVGNYDGDTLTVNIEGLPPVFGHRMKVRKGIDTPEIRGKCEREKRFARRAGEISPALWGGCYYER